MKLTRKELLLLIFLRNLVVAVMILMVMYIAFMWGLLVGSKANAQELKPKYRIAIIDTGYSIADQVGPKLKLCKSGHFDFVSGEPRVAHSMLHGTYVAAVIAKELQTVDYCAVIYNVDLGKLYAMANIVSAFYKASTEKLNAINVSYSGDGYNIAEKEAILQATKSTVVFVAAGNNRANLDDKCLAFPACLNIPNLYPVGALISDTTLRLPTSNYGQKIKLWFNGIYSVTEQGTSFAAPRALAHYILKLNRRY